MSQNTVGSRENAWTAQHADITTTSEGATKAVRRCFLCIMTHTRLMECAVHVNHAATAVVTDIHSERTSRVPQLGCQGLFLSYAEP